MARNDNERQSSLPSSLIPHLYTAPQQPRDSSTRTTLDIDEQIQTSYPVSPVLFPFSPPTRQQPRREYPTQGAGTTPDLASLVPQQQFGGPLYDDPLVHPSRPVMSSRAPSFTFPPPPPPPPREFLPHRMSWNEGEAGPSSLMHSESRIGRQRRGSSLSPRVATQSDAFGRGTANFEHESSFGDVVRRDAERGPYFSLAGPPIQQQQHQMNTYFSQSSPNFHQVPQHQPPQLLMPVPDVAFTFRHDPYAYPAVGNLTLSTPSPHFRSSSSAEGAYLYRSDSRGPEPTSNDEFELVTRDNKRRRADSFDANDDADSRKQRNPRKTAVACNFCRGRKLRCNGARPTCSHCTARQIKCEYVSTPRRRGPGKAPKGSRPKKATASRLDPSSSSSNIGYDRLSAAVPEYELDALAPELRPYTSVMSLGSLDAFSFQPPAPAPRYPSYPHDQGLMREYYSRARTPRSRETSSEDRSDAERNEYTER